MKRNAIIIVWSLAAAAVGQSDGPPTAAWGADRLAAAVKSSDTAVAVEAARALGQLKDSAVAGDALRMALTNTKLAPAVRRAALDALITRADDRTAETLVEVLGDGNVGLAAADAIVWFKTPGLVADVGAVLRGDKKASRRAHAAYALGRLKDASAADGLREALGDDNSSVRARACEACGALGDRDAVPALDNIVKNDKDAETRCAAARALGTIKCDLAVSSLAAALADSRAEVRRLSAESLGAIGDARALNPLHAAAAEESDPGVKAAMVQAETAIRNAVLSGVKP